MVVKNVINWESMTYHDVFLPELCKIQHISRCNLLRWLRKRSLLRVQEEKILGLAGADATRYHCFLVWIYKLNVPKWFSGYIRRKIENYLLLYESIDLEPKIKILNISASKRLMFLSLDSLDLSHLVLVRASDKTIIDITDQQPPFSRSYNEQLKVNGKCRIRSI